MEYATQSGPLRPKSAFAQSTWVKIGDWMNFDKISLLCSDKDATLFFHNPFGFFS